MVMEQNNPTQESEAHRLLREAREREDMERFQARVKERQAQLNAVRERYASSQNTANRKNLIWLIFAFMMAGVVYLITRFLR